MTVVGVAGKIKTARCDDPRLVSVVAGVVVASIGGALPFAGSKMTPIGIPLNGLRRSPTACSEASAIFAPLDSLIFGIGELLDQIDDGPPKLCVWDLHECLGELEAIGGSEIVRYIL